MVSLVARTESEVVKARQRCQGRGVKTFSDPCLSDGASVVLTAAARLYSNGELVSTLTQGME